MTIKNMTNIYFFNKQLQLPSEHPAIIDAEGTITYKQLKERVELYSEFLRASGLKKGEHAAILSRNNAEFIVLVLSLWRLGAVPVPMNVRLLDEELQKLILHSEAEFIFIHEDLKERLSAGNNSLAERFVFPACFNAYTPQDPEINENEADLNECALILYTSGTTGSPKGVMHSFSTLLASAQAADTLLRHSSIDRWLASLPFYHIGGFSIPVRAFLYGASVIIPDSLKAEGIALSIKSFKPTLASFVTTTLRSLMEMGVKPNSGLRYMLLGGGPVDSELAKNAIAENWKAVKVYGSTETASLVTGLELEKYPEKLDSAGFPLPGNNIMIIGEDGLEVPAGKSGEILVEAPSVMTGYWNNPEETSEKLIDGFYHTGDLGHMDSDGFLYVEARRTDLIITGGENVNPLEVETAILRHGSVKEACVFALEDKQWGQCVAAALVVKGDFSEEELTAFLRGQLAAYKLPRRIFLLKELPRTSLGKLRRDYIRQMFQQS